MVLLPYNVFLAFVLKLIFIHNEYTIMEHTYDIYIKLIRLVHDEKNTYGDSYGDGWIIKNQTNILVDSAKLYLTQSKIHDPN